MSGDGVGLGSVAVALGLCLMLDARPSWAEPTKSPGSAGSSASGGPRSPGTKDEPRQAPKGATSGGSSEAADDASPSAGSASPAATGTAREATLGQSKGPGQRRVEPELIPAIETSRPKEAAKRAEPEAKPAKKGNDPKAARKAYQKGRAPKKPAANLPSGVGHLDPDVVARRSIAGGATRDDERNFPNDPELRALRDAERALFPRTLDGIEPGWSWDPPELSPEETVVSASGLPPGPRTETKSSTAGSVGDAAWLRALVLPDLPVRFDARLVRYLEFYRDNPSGRSIIRAWAKKCGKFSPALRAELARAGLPKDLVWLSLIESGHNPEIQSPAGAAGLWQLVPDTARIYGLTVDRWVDERLDPERSTAAALRYLDDLKRRFGTWELAMAAYNMGHAGLARAIRKYNTNDYWELSRHEAGVPWETALYVPKILAVALVMNNKAAFGIDDVQPDPAFQFDTVRVGSGVSLSRVAAAAQISVAVIEDLNPQWVASRTPSTVPAQHAKTYPVRVPLGAGLGTTRRLDVEIAKEPPLEPVLLRYGDTLASFAAARGLPEARLRELNNVANNEVITPGTVVLVPRGSVAVASAPVIPEVVIVPALDLKYSERRRVFYRTLPGDSLDAVAATFGVSRDDLVGPNSLDPSAKLLSGMVLQIFVPKEAKLERVNHREEPEVRVLTVGTPEFIDYYEGQQGKKRMVVKAEAGDTLKSIGAKYNLSVGWMERINRRSNRDPVAPGEAIIVYAPVPGGTPTAVSGAVKADLVPGDGSDALEPPTPSLLPKEQDL